MLRILFLLNLPPYFFREEVFRRGEALARFIGVRLRTVEYNLLLRV